jgi:flagellar basal body rod protein FlgC
MNAAALHLATAASNIVNVRTSAPADAAGNVLGAVYQPRDVVQSSLATGGVTASIVPRSPSFFIGADPNSPTGFSAFPNVDLGAEIVNTMIASTSYKAAAKLLSVDAQLSDALLSIST